MRIISGSAGGRRLTAPRGDATRPTADRVREAVFNILVASAEVPARVLDLYAGSGALGFESLSRGAERVVFVDHAEDAVAAMRKNAAELGWSASVEIAQAYVKEWLKRPATERFGWIFLDPPYAGKELDRALERLAGGDWLAPGGVIIAEHEWREAPADLYGRLALSDRRRYGQTAVSFYREGE
jgi:16S rRNA (guanine(966)-N(2))-methyltransferase RsmD